MTTPSRICLAIALVGTAGVAAAQPLGGGAVSADERFAELDRQLAALRAHVAALEAAQAAPAPAPAGEPFAWGDFTWLNGGSRKTSQVLDTKYFTPQFDVDLNYTYSFNRPIDHTIVGSTATFRHNELQLAFLGVGGDFHVGGARGRLFFQLGERAVGIPRNDVTSNRGQYDLATAMRYLSEAYAGWHFDKLHGVNVDVGEFFSYVGLFSYLQFENWAYQASYTSDNTPWFFVGGRAQIFPTDKLKVEIWIVNGWQTYGKFNELPGLGYQIDYRPRSWCKIVLSAYVGVDTQDAAGRVRFHTDDSLLLRFYDRPSARGISRVASSLTADLGFEQGDGVAAFHGHHSPDPASCTPAQPCEQDFLSAMLYVNVWFYRNKLSTVVGGGFMRNPGRYLVLAPPGLASPGLAGGFSTSPGTTFFGWDTSQNISYYPTENITLRLEHSFHHSSDAYYAGRGGVTGPDGYKCGGLYDPDARVASCAPAGWRPDLVQNESKLVLALLFRL